MPTPNRRRAPRLITCVPAGVQTAEKDRIGLIRDTSTEGASVFSKSKFNVDDTISLTIKVDTEDAHNIAVKGRIVRVERLRDGFWTFKLGVIFMPPREDLAPLFRQLAERQERLFGSSPP
jgi:hypothetical protein